MAYKLIEGDCLDVLKTFPSEKIQCVVTSPPYYGLRDYGMDKQIGIEESPEKYVENLVLVFREIWRTLKSDGVVWLNLGDKYVPNDMKINGSRIYGYKPKDLIGIPWKVAFALQKDRWYLRSDVIWNKLNMMPEPTKDRPTRCHEYVFLLTKNDKYYYDADSIREPWTDDRPHDLNRAGKFIKYKGKWKDDIGNHGVVVGNPEKGRNKRTVWTTSTSTYKGAHFATYPPELIEPCILAGSRKDDIILDPFCGSGTTGEVALNFDRRFIGIELNPEYVELSRKRITEFLGNKDKKKEKINGNNT